MQRTIIANPAAHCPSDILAEQVALPVVYYDMDGLLQQRIIEINRAAANDVTAFFTLARKLKFPIAKVVRASDEPYRWDDLRLMADNATSGFNYRPVTKTGQPSWHALGLAFDVNTRLNPYISYYGGTEETEPDGATWDPTIPGTLYGSHPLVNLMKKRGWEWGGDWTRDSGRVDYQHFQKPR